MRHAAHKALGRTGGLSISKLMSHPTHAAHSAKAMRHAAAVTSGGAVVELDAAVAEKINEIIPPTRRSIRLERQAENRRHYAVVSASLAALVGTTATAAIAMGGGRSRMAVADPATTSVIRPADGAASRSQDRASLDGTSVSGDNAQTSNYGAWDLGAANTSLDVAMMSKSAANNPKVADLMDQDAGLLPAGFDPNHATGDVGNAYEFSQCTWWVYVRRHQLGLPVGSHMGNGNMWASSARSLGYWVDNSARHVGDIMVFAAGQDGTDTTCGHVAIIEKINPDGSVETSECGSVMNGKTYSKTYSAAQVAQHDIIHY
ncbi:CHAP domain-containing protein [Bifidobacterium sp. ESL0763]|uniref:CHAP domain-containing protein n=1 Tax=Bifidobacterium sp. ESL0763 TaxID=2983227 RepID=UPI0023F75718|nr:CHAP domain-containing protein [Bifidobacterium sp. ESL0763]MDF7663508.1 CHAP domain-containing protein [Bifidobacterium sp. ESL0763]